MEVSGRARIPGEESLRTSLCGMARTAASPAAHRIVAVTPAGRRRYLELLKHYILKDTSIDEWFLWDNCRDPLDREYINQLEVEHSKIKVIRRDHADGSNRSVNGFYASCADESVFYIKVDDDIVYLPEEFGASLYANALNERELFLWWSPLVINNAICSWLLKYHSDIHIPEHVSCQAGDSFGWKDPAFAEKLHKTFLSAVEANNVRAFQVAHFGVSLARFSINCLGFFGEDVRRYGQQFCPADVDDEEWLSACLPSITGRPGRVVGNLTVSHFSFFTQERELLCSRILDRYYRLAGLQPPQYEIENILFRKRLYAVRKRLVGARRRLYAVRERLFAVT